MTMEDFYRARDEFYEAVKNISMNRFSVKQVTVMRHSNEGESSIYDLESVLNTIIDGLPLDTVPRKCEKSIQTNFDDVVKLKEDKVKSKKRKLNTENRPRDLDGLLSTLEKGSFVSIQDKLSQIDDHSSVMSDHAFSYHDTSSFHGNQSGFYGDVPMEYSSDLKGPCAFINYSCMFCIDGPDLGELKPLRQHILDHHFLEQGSEYVMQCPVSTCSHQFTLSRKASVGSFSLSAILHHMLSIHNIGFFQHVQLLRCPEAACDYKHVSIPHMRKHKQEVHPSSAQEPDVTTEPEVIPSASERDKEFERLLVTLETGTSHLIKQEPPDVEETPDKSAAFSEGHLNDVIASSRDVMGNDINPYLPHDVNKSTPPSPTNKLTGLMVAKEKHVTMETLSGNQGSDDDDDLDDTIGSHGNPGDDVSDDDEGDGALPCPGSSVKLLEYRCMFCPEYPEFSAWILLKKHITDAHFRIREDGVTVFPCTASGCAKTFTHYLSVSLHRVLSHLHARHGVPYPYFIKMFQCKEEGCQSKWITLRWLKQHLKQKHAVKDYTVCEHCGRSLRTSSMKRHLEGACPALKGNMEMKFKCDKCDKSYTSRLNLYAHVHKKHSGKYSKLVCHICSHESPCPSMLAEHLFTKHDISSGDRPILHCDKCEFRTLVPNRLTSHFKRYHVERTFVCESCGHTSNNPQTHKRHMEIHENVTHRCDKCDYTTIHKGALQKHVRAQHGTKRFKCPHCAYSSGYMENTLKHTKLCAPKHA